MATELTDGSRLGGSDSSEGKHCNCRELRELKRQLNNKTTAVQVKSESVDN